MRAKTKEELVEEAQDARKTVQRVTQYDGWVGHEPGFDSVMPADEHGDALSSSAASDELRISGSDLAVRIHIHYDAKVGDVLRVLDKLCDWIRQDFEGADDLAVREVRELQRLREQAAIDQFREHRRRVWGIPPTDPEGFPS